MGAVPDETPSRLRPLERRLVMIAAGVVLTLAASAGQELLEDDEYDPGVAPCPSDLGGRPGE